MTAGPDAGPGAPRSRTVPDAVFGPVTITDHAADGLVVVPGPGLPGVDLRRIGPVTERLVPIGSRRPGHVELRVDGHRHVLRPASGRLSRRSYHVHVELDGAPLLLAADSPTTARWIRGRSRRDHVLGTLGREGDHLLPARWCRDGTPGPTGRRRRSATPSPRPSAPAPAS